MIDGTHLSPEIWSADLRALFIEFHLRVYVLHFTPFYYSFTLEGLKKDKKGSITMSLTNSSKGEHGEHVEHEKHLNDSDKYDHPAIVNTLSMVEVEDEKLTGRALSAIIVADMIVVANVFALIGTGIFAFQLGTGLGDTAEVGQSKFPFYKAKH